MQSHTSHERAPSPMARPVNANPEATRRRILQAARSQFSIKGPGGTGLREVARRARVGLATVTHYFPSKQTLEDAVVAAIVEELSGLKASLMPPPGSITDLHGAVRQIIPVTCAYIRDHLPEVRTMMRLAVDSDRGHQETVQHVLLPMLDQGQVILAALAGVPVEHARMVLLSLNHLIIRYALTDRRELVAVTGVAAGDGAHQRAWQRVEDHLVDLMFAALGLPASKGT